MRDRRPTDRFTTVALLALSVLMPGVLFGLAGWQSRRSTLRDAETRVERTARLLQEHATKVFETERLAIDRVNGRLRDLDWANEQDRADLAAILSGLARDLDQIATITVTDSEGHLRASSRGTTADGTVSFADRDWFQAVRDGAGGLPFVSRSTVGRQSGRPVFSLAERAVGGMPGTFNGVVAISVDRDYLDTFYRAVDPTYEHAVALIRDDGAILAREPATELTQVGEGSAVLRMGQGPTDAVMRLRSTVDGVERLSAFRRIGRYPVFVTFAIGLDSALAAWRGDLLAYGLVAALASATLLAVSALAIRRATREHATMQRWQAATLQLRAEVANRERTEDQLRQSQKMEAIGRLVGGVAHDFNNLLTVIIGSLGLLKRRLADGEPGHLRLIEGALDGANRAAVLTHRLLAFSRQQPLAPEPVDVNRLLTGLSDMLRRMLGERYEIETVLAGGLWQTSADPNQLESALVNLAVNARDAMADGGKLTVETANTHLDEAYAASRTDVTAGQYVMIAVCDTGSGMPANVVAQAFEPFFTTKPVGKGTGLGLSQVYGFAKQSHGHCAIYSEVGHGTTVKLYLPRLPRAAQSSPPAVGVETPPVEQPARGETILVVEDEPLVRQFSVTVLREAGYRVVESVDGPGGLAILRTRDEIAMLFTDVVLTGLMNGRELAEAAQKLRSGLPVLFTTGYTRNAIIHHGRLDDGVNLIGKPFTPEALTAAVRRLLDGAAGSATHA